jgi:hypothetical protein
MRNELAEYLVEHARREGYSLPARPLVLIETEPDLVVGTFGIAVASQEEAGQGNGRTSAPPPSATPPSVPVAGPEPPLPPAPVEPPPSAAATMVYTPPPEPEREETATLEWNGSRYEIGNRVTVLGRSSECDITLADTNVSRRHAEIRRIGDGYSLVDLGSTNGTEVNGQRIQETALMSGDVISVGTTEITFERHLG